MIDPAKGTAGLQALNWIFVAIRSRAHKSGDKELADVADLAEYLVQQLATPEDETESFHKSLRGLAKWLPEFTLALERFESPRATWPR